MAFPWKSRADRNILKNKRPRPQGLEQEFDCLYCSGFDCPENSRPLPSVSVTMRQRENIAVLKCGVCNVVFQTRMSHMSEAVDVYHEWVDSAVGPRERPEADETNEQNAKKKVRKTEMKKMPAKKERERTEVKNANISTSGTADDEPLQPMKKPSDDEDASRSLATTKWICQPPYDCYLLGIRAGPDFDADMTAFDLDAGDVFTVTEEVRKEVLEDGVSTEVLFLKLSDGRGWAFDRKPGLGTMCKRIEVGKSVGGKGA